MQLLNDAEEQLDSVVDFDALDSPGRIDWHLFRDYLSFERATLLCATPRMGQAKQEGRQAHLVGG